MTDMSQVQMTAKGIATRERLLEAAARAFAEFGYERTRITDIVQRADVSHGNFYRHFTDKDEILLAVLQPLVEEVHQASRRGPGEKRLAAEAELVERNSAFFRAYAKHRHLLRVMREAAAQMDKSRFLDLWLVERSKFINRTSSWLKTLQQQKRLGSEINVQLLAEALGALTEQLAYVQIGLAKHSLTQEQIEELGQICGHIWYQAIFGNAPAVLPTTVGQPESGFEHTRDR